MDVFNFLTIKQDSIDNKKSSLLLTTVLSVVGIAALAVIELVVASPDEDESEQDALDE